MHRNCSKLYFVVVLRVITIAVFKIYFHVVTGYDKYLGTKACETAFELTFKLISGYFYCQKYLDV